MSGLLNIGLTGLMAAQGQLNTTSHNITNAATPNFTRQRVVQGNNNPQITGSGFFGRGTHMQAVERQYSEYLESQVLNANNRLSEYKAYGDRISQINNMLADPTAGLSPGIKQFFAGVQEVSVNPTSIPARQALISTGKAFAERFHSLNTRLEEIRSGVEGQIGSTLESINNYAKEIAKLNQRIVAAQTSGPSVPANDLLDQRDRLVQKLNELVKTNTVVEGDGQLSVFIGTGQTLVIGQNVSQFGTEAAADDPTRNNIALVTENGTTQQLPENLLSGGELGGLLAFRRDALDPSRDQLNRIARQLSTFFNEQHRKGVTLEGNLGKDFFRLDMAVSDGGNPATLPEVSVTNDNLLTNDRYRVVYDSAQPGGFSMTHISTGAAVNPADVGLAIQPPTGAVNGDAYIVAPLRHAARDIQVALSQPRDIAAGNPVSVKAEIHNGGSGKVDNIQVQSTEGMAVAYPQFTVFEMRYDAATQQLNLNGAGGFQIDPSPASFNPATESAGKTFTVKNAAGTDIFSFTFQGKPADGAKFTFSPTQAGVADNRNAVQLGTLQSSKTMLIDSAGNNTATFQSAYSQLVTMAGNRGQEIELGMKSQQTLLKQARDSRDALSGVNLDEEAANLLRYQQAYQASGRIMSVAQRLFDEIVSLGR